MKQRICFLTTFMFLIGLMGLMAEDLVDVAHVSYLDGGLNITNRDGNSHVATVNFPILPGDLLKTEAEGRAEIQFGNGTLVRMDKDSEVKIGTILAPILSSNRWRMTTLELKKGRVYIDSNVYNLEMMQMVTDDVAVSFPRNTNTEMVVIPETGTQVICHWRKADLLYTDAAGKEQSSQVDGKGAVLVSKTNGLKPLLYKEEGDFYLWNRNVGKHFKELHLGKSYVPEKIIRHKHLQMWAERWSSSFGEWVYDKMFGYMWKPRGFSMDPYRRPFWNAKLVVLNGEEYLLPDESWGFAPAHLGTWVFLKKWGWTWIPGQGSNQIFMPRVHTLMDWIWHCWGSNSLYYTYLEFGENRWRDLYQLQTGDIPPTIALERVPHNVRIILKKFETVYVHKAKEFLDAQRTDFIGKGEVVRVKRDVEQRLGGGDILGRDPDAVVRVKPLDSQVGEKGAAIGQAMRLRHDWNPDRKWANQNRVHLLYSSNSNSIICPQMKFDSANISNRDRAVVARVAGTGHNGGSSPFDSNNSSNTSSTSTSSGSEGATSSGSSSMEKK